MMDALSSADIVRLWEAGRALDPVHRALLLVRAADATLSMEESLTMPVGERDAYLIRMREMTFGPTLEGHADCPACASGVLFELETRRLGEPEDRVHEHTLHSGSFDLRFRVPNSADLLAAAAVSDPGAARALVLSRCVLTASRNGRLLDPADLPDEIVMDLCRRMVDVQPDAEVMLDLECAACGHRWQALLDIAAFLWQEIASAAGRLIREVHVLASAYGWGEQDILALSDLRRRRYLQLVAG
ncbi:MAG TPA: hypothetical protein VGR24_07825 [bacterium]|jgi:hypothetical protein|nr:hypothetical protein [bacterium]